MASRYALIARNVERVLSCNFANPSTNTPSIVVVVSLRFDVGLPPGALDSIKLLGFGTAMVYSQLWTLSWIAVELESIALSQYLVNIRK